MDDETRRGGRSHINRAGTVTSNRCGGALTGPSREKLGPLTGQRNVIKAVKVFSHCICIALKHDVYRETAKQCQFADIPSALVQIKTLTM